MAPWQAPGPMSGLAREMSAPVTAIVAYDTRFYDLLPRLFPHDQTARSWFAGEAKEKATAVAALIAAELGWDTDEAARQVAAFVESCRHEELSGAVA